MAIFKNYLERLIEANTAADAQQNGAYVPLAAKYVASQSVAPAGEAFVFTKSSGSDLLNLAVPGTVSEAGWYTVTGYVEGSGAGAAGKSLFASLDMGDPDWWTQAAAPADKPGYSTFTLARTGYIPAGGLLAVYANHDNATDLVLACTLYVVRFA